MHFFKKTKPAPVQNTVDTDDTIFEMKMQAKMLERAAKRSDKEAKQQVNKARGALIKGNEEGAKYPFPILSS
jgi:hypothetical protein